MTRTLISTAAAVCFAAGALLAQGTTTSPDSKASTTTSDRVTASGCIERADQVAANETSAATTVGSLDFVLIRADSRTASATTEPAPTGTTGTTGSTTAAPSSRDNSARAILYRLAGETSKLNPQVGHRVEIVGTLDKSAPSAASTTTAVPAGSMPTLKVDSVTMLSDTCPR